MEDGERPFRARTVPGGGRGRRPRGHGSGRRGALGLGLAAALAVAALPASAVRAGVSAAPRRTATATSPFAIRGVVEGYYGLSWSPTATIDVLAFMAAHGMNTFVYAPKFDPYQRADWREPYPPAALHTLAEMVAAARRDHITFVYSISPGLSIVYSSTADRRALVAKLAQLRSIGVHEFMLSFDDVGYNLNSPADVARYHNSLSLAQVDLLDWLYRTEIHLDPHFHMIFTPTDYDGTQPNIYFTHIARLNPAIDIVWTGPGVVSPTITVADAEAASRLLHRPPLIWYNYPVNDWTVPAPEFAHPATMQPRDLFLGPVRGLAPGLGAHVRGLLANPMLEPYASEIPLATVAAYLADPAGWNPAAAWQAALAAAGGPATGPLTVFASALSPYPEILPNGDYTWSSTDPAADRLEAEVLAAFRAAPDALLRLPATSQLRATFASWVADAPALRDRLPNPALAAEIAPWVQWMPREGRDGLDALQLLADAAAGRRAAVSRDLARVKADEAALATADVQFGGQLALFLQRAAALA